MRRTILLADDSPTIQRLVKNTLADADFELVSVSNGEAALRKFEEIHPHVVLADIYMPGKTGYEVCSYIRQHQHPAVRTIPVILLVGAFDVFDEAKAKEIGATSHITKPFEPHALFSMIESVMPPEEVTMDETILNLANRTVIIPPEAMVAAVRADTAKVEPVKAEPAKAEPAIEPPKEAVREPAKELAKTAAPRISEDDLLGLELLFPEPPGEPAAAAKVTDQDVDRIADRVIQRISSQVIESIAWDLVPDIAERVVREELKRTHES